MYNLSIESKPYKTYILTDPQAQTRLEVVPERGGIITRWQVAGQEILYLDEARFADPALSVRGGIPILFPICGNLPDNTYVHQGQDYQLNQHGFARDLPWSIRDSVSELVDHEGVGLTLTLGSSDRTLAIYPFEFQLEFTYLLQNHSLIIDQSFTNLSSEVMPFSTGLHPYFTVADKTQLQFDIPAEHYRNHKDQTIHTFSGNFDFNQAEIDVAFADPNRTSASVTALDRKLTLTSDPLYSTLVFWTLKDKAFYCLEPWTAGRNALNTGEKLTHLKPGDRLTTRVTLTVEAG